MVAQDHLSRFLAKETLLSTWMKVQNFQNPELSKIKS